MKAIITQRVIALFAAIFFISVFAGNTTAQRVRYYHADTGMVALGPNELLRLTVAPTFAPPTMGTFNFRITATASSCTNDLCVHTVTTQNSTGPIPLNPGQAVSYDVTQPPGASAVRAGVELTNPNVVVNAFIIDRITGATRGFTGRVYVMGGRITEIHDE